MSYNVPNPLLADLSACLLQSDDLSDFLMRFDHILPEPAGSRPLTCALTIALGYFVGGFVPLVPYIFVEQHQVDLGLYCSICIMVIALFAFGYVKSCYVSGWRGWRNTWIGVRGGLEMVFIGSVASGAAMGLVILFNRGARSGN
jgi:VIT1/CCC1 family predicted Fe2+/Mn2+ transporter